MLGAIDRFPWPITPSTSVVIVRGLRRKIMAAASSPAARRYLYTGLDGFMMAEGGEMTQLQRTAVERRR